MSAWVFCADLLEVFVEAAGLAAAGEREERRLFLAALNRSAQHFRHPVAVWSCIHVHVWTMENLGKIAKSRQRLATIAQYTVKSRRNYGINSQVSTWVRSPHINIFAFHAIFISEKK